MSEENKAVSRRMLEARDKGDWETYLEQFAPNYVLHSELDIGSGQQTVDRERVLQEFRTGAAAIAWGSDAYHAIEDQIAEGDKVVTRSTWHATHTGEYHGIPATGKQITMARIQIHRMVGGKVVEAWVSAPDHLDLMRQLGASE